MVSEIFVLFIFYSFLGWVWESIYCTIKERKWLDRGFLFGPICPIYGSCVVVTTILFENVSPLNDPDVPAWEIFAICMAGSAIAEFSTSWVLEKRFHARWWDYSSMPLNVQGRICLPVSVGFGLAGILVVRWLIPSVEGVCSHVPDFAFQILGLITAMSFGADFALTEASLSDLIKEVQDYKAELNAKAQNTYTVIAGVTGRIEADAAAVRNELGVGAERVKELADSHAHRLNLPQRRAIKSIRRFVPAEHETLHLGRLPIEHLREAVLDRRKGTE